MRLNYIIFPFFVFFLLSCSRPQAVPRPVGWLRLELGQAQVDSVGPEEIDVRFPGLAATLYLTRRQAESPQQAQDMVNNRLERIHLDAAGADVRTLSASEGMLFLSPEAPATPLHYMATDGQTYLHYGVLVMDGSMGNFDSIAPLIDSVGVQIPLLFNRF